MDGRAEHACLVLGVSLHYADTFFQCGHFFGPYVVIVGSAPAGVRDPFWGTVKKSLARARTRGPSMRNAGIYLSRTRVQ